MPMHRLSPASACSADTSTSPKNSLRDGFGRVVEAGTPTHACTSTSLLMASSNDAPPSTSIVLEAWPPMAKSCWLVLIRDTTNEASRVMCYVCPLFLSPSHSCVCFLQFSQMQVGALKIFQSTCHPWQLKFDDKHRIGLNRAKFISTWTKFSKFQV